MITGLQSGVTISLLPDCPTRAVSLMCGELDTSALPIRDSKPIDIYILLGETADLHSKCAERIWLFRGSVLSFIALVIEKERVGLCKRELRNVNL